MSAKSRQHTSDEFGKSTGTGSQFTGLDGPIMGAPSSIIIAGITERESGVTPSPPPVSVKAFVIAFAVMFVIGVIGVIVWLRVAPSIPTPFGL